MSPQVSRRSFGRPAMEEGRACVTSPRPPPPLAQASALLQERPSATGRRRGGDEPWRTRDCARRRACGFPCLLVFVSCCSCLSQLSRVCVSFLYVCFFMITCPVSGSRMDPCSPLKRSNAVLYRVIAHVAPTRHVIDDGVANTLLYSKLYKK